MALIKINKNPPDREIRQFCGIWLPPGIVLLSFVFLESWHARMILWSVAATVAVLGLAWPKLIKPLYVVLNYAVFPIGFVLSYVILAVVYYLVFTPVGLIMRLVGYDPLERKLDRTASTYWIKRDAAPAASRYFRQI